MRPAPFEYFAPRTVEEALDLLGRHGDEAKLLAGGQSLVPMMNMRLVRPAVVIDLNHPLAGKTLHKARIHGLIRKGLPFDEDSPLAYGFEIRNPDIGPFRACADVNQLRALVSSALERRRA